MDRRKIQLAHPVKELGTVKVAIKMPRDVMATVTVNVVKKQDAQESPEVPEAQESENTEETSA